MPMVKTATMAKASDSPTRRQTILRVALDCFLARGVAQTTIEEIRDRSRASIGSIYHHFGGKEAIAGALYIEALSDYQSGFIKELERHTAARSGVRSIVAYHLRWIEQHPERARYLFHMRGEDAIGAVEADIAELNQAFFARIALWLEPQVMGGAIRRLPTELLSAILIAPAQQFGRAWVAGRARVPLDRAVRELADAAWLAVKGPRP